MSGRLTIVMPAAGQGMRFLRAGVTTPKPLISFSLESWFGDQVRKPMFAHAMAGCDPIWEAVIGIPVGKVGDYWHAVRDSHGARPGVNHYITIAHSSGQSHTIQQLLGHVHDGEVLVLNSDQSFAPGVLQNFVSRARELVYDKAVICFASRSPAYSYVEVLPESQNDHEATFASAVEKHPVSTWAIAGAFWFRDARQLARALTRQEAVSGTDEERYLSEAMNCLPGRGWALRIPDHQMRRWGTPEDLAQDAMVRTLDPEVDRALAPFRKPG